MTSSHFPSLYCLVCGQELSDFDSLESHTTMKHKEDNREAKLQIRDSLKNR